MNCVDILAANIESRRNNAHWEYSLERTDLTHLRLGETRLMMPDSAT